MKRIILSTLILIMLFILSCGRVLVREDSVIHLSIRSNPNGAEVYWRVVSKTPDVKSSNRFYLGYTPYRATRSLHIPGLSPKNISDVALVIIVKKKGYKEATERYNLAGVLNDNEISAKFVLSR